MKHLPKKKPVWELPLDLGSNCVGGRVRMLSRVVSSIYGEAFAPLDLKLSQFSVLAVLSHQGAVAATALCPILMMDKATASRTLQRRRRRGWSFVSARLDRGGP